MKNALDHREISSLLLGSSFFACGGGVPISSSQSQVSKLAHDSELQLVSFDSLDPDDLICTVYAIGASGAARKSYDHLLKAFDALERHIGKRITGIVPGEVGSEINAIWVAAHRSRLLIDSDMVGGRAVPEEQMDVHSVSGVTTAPTVAVNTTDDEILVSCAQSPHVLEAVYRAFAVSSGGYCYLAGRPMCSADAQTILPSYTMSKALTLGQQIEVCESVEQFSNVVDEVCSAKLMAEAQVVAIAQEDRPGFTAVRIRLDGLRGHKDRSFSLLAVNENIILLGDDSYLCSAPDLISVVSATTLQPMHNSSLQLGDEVLIYAAPPIPFWRTEEAIEVFNPRTFGFDYSYRSVSEG